MPDVLVRDLDPKVIDRLKRRAKDGNRSLQAEMKAIIDRAAANPDALSRRELLRAFRDSLSRDNLSDSVDLLREDRDR